MKSNSHNFHPPLSAVRLLTELAHRIYLGIYKEVIAARKRTEAVA